MATKREEGNGHKRPHRAERVIPADDVAKTYLSCTMCALEAKKEGVNPKEFARLSVSFTEIGLQVYCLRHDANVLHIDFEGHKHPANVQPK